MIILQCCSCVFIRIKLLVKTAKPDFCSAVELAFEKDILLYKGLLIFRLKEYLDYEGRTNMKNGSSYF